MFNPKYSISNQLLENIKQINLLISKLNHRQFPKIVLLELEKIAQEVSTYASTSIEGNPLPLTEVKKILKNKPQNIRDSEREVINYNQALESLGKLIAKKDLTLSSDLILKIHQQVMHELLPKSQVGSFRQQPIVVNDPKTGNLVFLPPDANEVEALMNDLITFINKNEGAIDPIILAGIFHKQMVIIHPFIDGNGRTTRLATKLLLAKMGLNTFNLFSFENYYNQNVTKYFQFVGEYGDYAEIKDDINFSNWLEYFSEGVADELQRVMKQLSTFSPSPETKLENHHQKILGYIRDHGYINDREYANLTNRAKATRTLDFQKLIKLGLIERKGKGRSTYYVLKE